MLHLQCDEQHISCGCLGLSPESIQPIWYALKYVWFVLSSGLHTHTHTPRKSKSRRVQEKEARQNESEIQKKKEQGCR